ncbi:hypothetical protein JW872_00550 [Candidatus Babeliales bacterium]|nr:hypothetical protein [Candidatus Babeliales bacterium]
MRIKNTGYIVGLCAIQAMGASSSFFVPRQITTDPTFELGLNYFQHMYREDVDTDKFYSDITANIVYQNSTNEEELARYFLKDNKCSLAVRENGTGDLGSLWFQTIAASGASYSSTLTLFPERHVWGIVPAWYASWKKFWANVTTSLIGVEHDANLSETSIINQGTTSGFETLTNYFKNTDATYGPNYGRIDSVERDKVGLDDIQCKIGYTPVKRDNGHLGFYLVGTIPTGRDRSAVNMFAPVVGSKNGSFGLGAYGDVELLKRDRVRMSFMSDLKYRYVFSHHEMRSFDLTNNGDWSRYLLVVTNASRLDSQPAINYLTCSADIAPRSTIDFWNALHIAWHTHWNFETGYVFWWRQSEKITTGSCCTITDNGVGIFDMAGALAGSAVSAGTANITMSAAGTNVATSDASFTTIQTSDLNLCSGAHPSSWSHKIYGAFAYDNDWGKVGFGGSYEFAAHKALEQWGLWGNISVAF